MEKKRVAYLDALKGLCMLIVVDGHIMNSNGFYALGQK
jgi:fucose 4-O-acetylase-like acetyltransferase